MAIKRVEDIWFPAFFHLSEILLFYVCWSCLQVFWNRAGVNYRACFGLDLLGSTAIEIIAEVGILISIYCFFFALFTQSYHCMMGSSAIPIGVYCFMMYVAILIYAVLWSGKPLVLLLGSCLTSPFTGVSTLDAYVGDVLLSLIKPIDGVFYAGCLFTTGEFMLKLDEQGWCEKWWFESKMTCWPTIVILVFPGALRTVQNLRQLYDTKKQHPCLTNVGKYVVGLLVSLFALMHQEPSLRGGGNLFFYLYLIPYLGATLYAFLWDIFMDWNFFPSQNTVLCFPRGGLKLREQRLYGNRYLYYGCAFVNFILRFFGTLTYIPKAWGLLDTNSEILRVAGWAAPTLEVLRRALWSIFKVEAMELGDFSACATELQQPLLARVDRVPTLQHASSERRKLALEIFTVVALVGCVAAYITVTGVSYTFSPQVTHRLRLAPE